MSTVEIEYCVPCGYRERAVGVASNVLAETEEELDALTLVMGAHGVFEVRVDGEPVFDKDLEPYDEEAILSAVREAI